MNLQTLIKSSGAVINILIGIMVGLAVLVFFWGLVVFIFKSGDVESHTEGKNRMIFGVIGLFVMVSVWGIIQFVSNDLGLGPTVTVRHLDFPENTDNSPNPCGNDQSGNPIPCGATN